jgi:methyl-accepting chemotaxis protein
LSDAGQVAEAVQVAEKDLQPAYAKVDEAIGSLVEYNKNNLHGGIARVQHASHLGKLTILVGLAVALAAAAVIAFGIVRSTNKILNEVAGTLDVGSEQVACAASQVSASSQSLAQGSSEQAASLEETSASMEEMASMTKRNAENSQEARGAANQARVSADEGAKQIQAMQVAMDGIQNASKEIAKILKTIDEIAFETNILALNAAVEAARAGEAGSGFAVVAEEVRALAQRCSAAAKETAQKIEDAGTKSTQGVQISEKVTKSFETIQGHIHRVDRIVGEIATASDEQSQGIHQVTTAVSQMDQVTQSTASSAEETAAAAEELTAQASVMRDTVGQLMKFIGSVAKSTPDLGNDEISATRKAPSPRAEARGERRPSFSGFLKRGAAPRAGSNGTADTASRGVVKMNGKIPNSDSFADQH